MSTNTRPVVPADECTLCVLIGGYCGNGCSGAFNWYRAPVETRAEFVERCEQREADENL